MEFRILGLLANDDDSRVDLYLFARYKRWGWGLYFFITQFNTQANMFKLAISFVFAAFVAEAVYAQTIPVGRLCKSDFVVHANLHSLMSFHRFWDCWPSSCKPPLRFSVTSTHLFS
jgi:hypothetical protein